MVSIYILSYYLAVNINHCLRDGAKYAELQILLLPVFVLGFDLMFYGQKESFGCNQIFVLVKTKRRAYSSIFSVYPERDKKEGVGRIPSYNRSAKHKSSDRWQIKISRHLASLLTITALIKYFFTFFRLYKSLLPIFGTIYFLFISLPLVPPLVWK